MESIKPLPLIKQEPVPNVAPRSHVADIFASAQTDSAAVAYREARTAHWNSVAIWIETHERRAAAYHRRLREIFRFICPPGKRVLEIGCAYGDLLASLEP